MHCGQVKMVCGEGNERDWGLGGSRAEFDGVWGSWGDDILDVMPRFGSCWDVGVEVLI